MRQAAKRKAKLYLAGGDSAQARWPGGQSPPAHRGELAERWLGVRTYAGDGRVSKLTFALQEFYFSSNGSAAALRLAV